MQINFEVNTMHVCEVLDLDFLLNNVCEGCTEESWCHTLCFDPQEKFYENFFTKLTFFLFFSCNETFMRVIFFQTKFTECIFNAVFTEYNTE